MVKRGSRLGPWIEVAGGHCQEPSSSIMKSEAPSPLTSAETMVVAAAVKGSQFAFGLVECVGEGRTGLGLRRTRTFVRGWKQFSAAPWKRSGFAELATEGAVEIRNVAEAAVIDDVGDGAMMVPRIGKRPPRRIEALAQDAGRTVVHSPRRAAEHSARKPPMARATRSPLSMGSG